MDIETAEDLTFGQIAAKNNVSHGTVRNLFRDEPGVRRVAGPLAPDM